MSGSSLLDSFFSIFDTSAAEMGKLVKELAEIYEDSSKREGLLKSWNDWRAINEDYPSLPGPNGTLPGMTSNTVSNGGRRVLKLKSSTAQSSRSVISRQGSWGNALSPTPSRSSTQQAPAFPPLANPNGPKKANAPMWVAPSSNARSSPAPSRPASTKPPASTANSEAFPALPAGVRPNTLMAGLTKGSVRWNDKTQQTAASSPWGAANDNTSAPPVSATVAAVEGADAADTVNGKKKGKKGKGQLLYHFG